MIVKVVVLANIVNSEMNDATRCENCTVGLRPHGNSKRPGRVRYVYVVPVQKYV